LKALHVLGFEALVALNDFEVDDFTFLQRFEAAAHNCGMVDKHILA